MNNSKSFKKRKNNCWQTKNIVIGYTSRFDERHITSKTVSKNLLQKMKKFLTNRNERDKLYELSERQTQWTLITKQWNTYDSRKFLLIKFLRTNLKTVKREDSQVLSDRYQTLYQRVWSWLRMNAGGVLNTCKSNEKPIIETSVDLICF